MNIYFVRHGQSKGNSKGLLQGPDTVLSNEGKKQARLIAKRLKGLNIDVIYASPYLRTKQTAKIIAKELKLSIEYWEDLKERKRPSEIEGLRYDDEKVIEVDRMIRENRHIADWKYSDDESFNDMQNRAKQAEKHLFEHHRNQNVLCVSHSGIMKMIVLNTILQEKLTPEVFGSFTIIPGPKTQVLLILNTQTDSVGV